MKVSARDIKFIDLRGRRLPIRDALISISGFLTLTLFADPAPQPVALRDGAPFKNRNLPRPLQVIRDHYRNQPEGDQDFIELLMLYQKHGQEAVEMACELA